MSFKASTAQSWALRPTSSRLEDCSRPTSTANITQIRPFTSDQTIKADWAPNGRRIAVTENANHFQPNDSANIVTMRPDRSGLRRLTKFHDPMTNAYLGSYSPDGQWLVFRLEAQGFTAGRARTSYRTAR